MPAGLLQSFRLNISHVKTAFADATEANDNCSQLAISVLAQQSTLLDLGFNFSCTMLSEEAMSTLFAAPFMGNLSCLDLDLAMNKLSPKSFQILGFALQAATHLRTLTLHAENNPLSDECFVECLQGVINIVEVLTVNFMDTNITDDAVVWFAKQLPVGRLRHIKLWLSNHYTEANRIGLPAIKQLAEHLVFVQLHSVYLHINGTMPEDEAVTASELLEEALLPVRNAYVELGIKQWDSIMI
eukprot:TRINITY_DN48930_c0_g2_i1.p1 TRINITY_DN48930_c0_g2~~TRINITY_DN48930_c0_g2_i1.p1  ORF type:complete len:242 (-),score=18.50 TRINITY_DN48930_c0_g2_i1:20-745(-)